MAYKIRVILDVKKDVIRDLIVNQTINLEKLHFMIAKSFGFKGQEMASFYTTNNQWEQGEEIPLFNMSEDDDSLSMQNCTLNEILQNKGDKLIYVYDFLSMWTFFVEVSEIIKDTVEDLPKISFSFGNTPEEAPEKKFEAINTQDNFDAFEDEDGLENIDDFDFDNY